MACLWSLCRKLTVNTSGPSTTYHMHFWRKLFHRVRAEGNVWLMMKEHNGIRSLLSLPVSVRTVQCLLKQTLNTEHDPVYKQNYPPDRFLCSFNTLREATSDNTDVPKVPGAVLPRVSQAHNFRAGKSIAHFLIQKSVLFVIIKEFPQSRTSELFKMFV